MPHGVKKKSARRKQKDKQRKANNRKILAGGHPTRKKVHYEPPPIVEEEDDSDSSSSSESSSSESSSSLARPIVPKQVIPRSSLSRRNSVTWSDLTGPESKRSLGTGTNSNTTKGSSQGPQTSGFPRAKEILKKDNLRFGKRPSVVIEKGESQIEVDEQDSDSDESSSGSDSDSEYTSSSETTEEEEEEEEMKFTYPMWHRHHIMVETALHSHTEQAEIMKTGMKRLQKVHDQTETHPIIAKLLIAKLTYEGFEFDKRFAMDLYLKLEDKAAKEFIMDMVKKQKSWKMKQDMEKNKKLKIEETKQSQQKQQDRQESQESDDDSSSSEEESESEEESSSDDSSAEEKKMEEPLPKKATPKPPSQPVQAQVIQSYNNDGVPSYITSGDDTSYSSVGASVGGSNPFKHVSSTQQTLPQANPVGGIFDNVNMESMEWKTSKQTLSTRISQPNSELMKVDMDVSVSSESPRDVMRRIETQWTKNYRPSRRRSVDVVSKESARERMRRLEQKYHKNSSM